MSVRKTLSPWHVLGHRFKVSGRGQTSADGIAHAGQYKQGHKIIAGHTVPSSRIIILVEFARESFCVAYNNNSLPHFAAAPSAAPSAQTIQPAILWMWTTTLWPKVRTTTVNVPDYYFFYLWEVPLMHTEPPISQSAFFWTVFCAPYPLLDRKIFHEAKSLLITFFERLPILMEGMHTLK